MLGLGVPTCLPRPVRRSAPPFPPVGCASPQPRPAGNWLICQRWSGENPSLMITLLFHLLRLLPFLCGGHEQLALENVALRQQLAVYKRTARRPKLRRSDRLFFSECGPSGRQRSPHFGRVIDAPIPPDRKQDPCQAPRQGHCGDGSAAPSGNPIRPGPQRGHLRSRAPAQNAPRGLDQEPAHAAIPRLGDVPSALGLARTPFAGNQPHIGFHLMRAPESGHVVHGGDERRRGHRPHAGHGSEMPGHLARRDDPPELLVQHLDLVVEGPRSSNSGAITVASAGGSASSSTRVRKVSGAPGRRRHPSRRMSDWMRVIHAARVRTTASRAGSPPNADVEVVGECDFSMPLTREGVEIDPNGETLYLGGCDSRSRMGLVDERNRETSTGCLRRGAFRLPSRRRVL